MSDLVELMVLEVYFTCSIESLQKWTTIVSYCNYVGSECSCFGNPVLPEPLRRHCLCCLPECPSSAPMPSLTLAT